MTGSDLIANDDPVKVERARSLLRSAAKAVDAFEDAIRELVAMRAWAVLGYKDLAAMWEAENGFNCPTYAKVLAFAEYLKEGVVKKKIAGLSLAEIACELGVPTSTSGGRYHATSPTLSSFKRQIEAGVPLQYVVSASGIQLSRVIEAHGARARAIPRRHGKLPDEPVSDSIYLARREADQIAELAREADVPKAEIYRQAVAEYLQRHNVSTHFGHAPNGATPEVPEVTE